MIGIRGATALDIQALQAVEVDAGTRFQEVGLAEIADDPPPTAEELSPYIRFGTAFVAVDDDQVLGYALCSALDGDAHLDQVSVAREAQGLGIGRALIDRVDRWAASHGFEWLTLTTFRDVEFNGPLYLHLGFEELPVGDYGPELVAMRRAETDAGLDLTPRVAMRRRVGNPPPRD